MDTTWLDRDGDEGRREDLLASHERLRRMTAAILRSQFPRLTGRHDADSVLHQAWPHLLKALENVPITSRDDLVRLAALKVRQVMLELVRKQQRREQVFNPYPSDGGEGDPGPADHDDPSMLAELAEVHNLVAELPAHERTVFEMHYYLDMSQSDIARALDQTPKQVSRLWLAAAGRLGRKLASGRRG